MRHERTLGVDDQSAVGLFFGSQTRPWPMGGDVESWYVLAYNDFDPSHQPKERPPGQAISLRQYTQLVRPNSALSAAGGLIGSRTFTPPARGSLPIWRYVEIDVRPGGINASWRDETGKILPVGTNMRRLNEIGQDCFDAVARNVQEPAPTWFGWSPQGSVGLLVVRGQASFRNVVIEP
jgi:hypothetical protein